MCWATSDNINQQFTLDLLHDPYWVGSALLRRRCELV
jgi:hypothetical protein